jgi:hypothetical protein
MWIASGITAFLVMMPVYLLTYAPAAYFAGLLDHALEEPTENSFDFPVDRAFDFSSAVGCLYMPANWAIHRAPDPVYVWFSDYWYTWNGSSH